MASARNHGGGGSEEAPGSVERAIAVAESFANDWVNAAAAAPSSAEMKVAATWLGSQAWV